MTTFAPVLNKVTPSVVKVATVVKAKMTSGEVEPPDSNLPPMFRGFFGHESQWDMPNQPMRVPPQHGVGSGVIVTKDGYILTNNHVVDSAADAIRLTETAKDKVTLVRVWSNGTAHFVVVDESQDKAA